MKCILSALLMAVLVAQGHAADQIATDAGPVGVTRVVSGLDEPWAIGFLPDGSFLITERHGALHYFRDGATRNVSGVPKVHARGQGGLLDVVVARDFASSGEVFLTFSKPARGGGKTALARATFDAGRAALTDLTILFEMSAASGAGQHYGSRVVEAPDGTLWLTIGDRGARDMAQNPNAHNGKVVRVGRDGRVPADNPFAGGGALPEIWSLGHRNPQGAALDANGRLWTVEHGARGGDEVNMPLAGRNYGWPVISYGRHYSGAKIGVGTRADGMEQPEFYWDPSIAPSGMMIYSGKLFPAWKGDIFVGSLKFDMISRLEVSGGKVSEAERLFQDRYIRIRDIREAPDGSIWFLSVGDGAAYRITPG